MKYLLETKKWVPVVDNFHKEFHQNLETKYNEINKQDIMPEEERQGDLR